MVSLKKLLTNILIEIEKSELVIERITKTMSVPANSYNSEAYSILKSGYTPLGVIGFQSEGSGNTYMSFYKSIINRNDTTVVIGMRNHSNTARSISATVDILYKKN